MNRFITRCIHTIYNVHTHRTTNSTEAKGDRATEGDTIRSRYRICLKHQESYRRTIVSGCGRILQECRKKDASKQLDKGKRSKKESVTCSSIRLSLSLFFYPIIYNPQLWVFLFILDTSFADELIAYSAYNLSVIMHTTHCLLTKGCIG